MWVDLWKLSTTWTDECLHQNSNVIMSLAPTHGAIYRNRDFMMHSRAQHSNGYEDWLKTQMLYFCLISLCWNTATFINITLISPRTDFNYDSLKPFDKILHINITLIFTSVFFLQKFSFFLHLFLIQTKDICNVKSNVKHFLTVVFKVPKKSAVLPF